MINPQLSILAENRLLDTLVIGNEMHEVGTLHDDHFPNSLKDACLPPEKTAYSTFLKYPRFANTCFNTGARDYHKMYFFMMSLRACFFR